MVPPATATAQVWVFDTGTRGEAFAWRHHLGSTGFDPDVNSMGGDARFGGIDIGAYPQSRVWNVGVSATY